MSNQNSCNASHWKTVAVAAPDKIAVNKIVRKCHEIDKALSSRNLWEVRTSSIRELW